MVSLFLLASALMRAQETPPAAPGLLEAVQTALRHNRQLQSQQWQVEISHGTLLQATGQFDTTFDLTASRGHLPQDIAVPGGLYRTETNSLNYTASVTQRLRNGVVVTPGVTVSQVQDNFQNFVAAGTGGATLTVTVPLLKGRGTVATGGTEQAARLGLDAARLVYAQAVATTAGSVADAYWSWLAASRRLDAQRAAEARARRLLAETTALVKADMVPAADLAQPEADLANNTGSRLLAEQDLFNATQALGLAMGLTGGELAHLAPAAEPFPDPGSAPVPDLSVADAYSRLALKLRQDYQAATANAQATEILYRAARLNERPTLNLGLQAGYTGLEMGRFSDPWSPLVRNQAGPSYGVQFTLDWPFANHAAQGYTRQQRAQFEQARLQAADLAANIGSDVASAVQNLRIGMETLRQAQRASALFADAVEKERQKFQLGESTVLDQLTIEDRATQAELSLVSAQLLYATAVVGVRLETGTLVEAQGDVFNLRDGALRTLPAASP